MIEWSIPAGTLVLLTIQTVGGITTIAKLSLSIQRALDAKFAAQDLSFERIGNEIKATAILLRAEFHQDTAAHKQTFMESLNKCGHEINELSHRVGTLETGQDEWTQTLRKRTHEIAEKLNLIVLRVDRLERPVLKDRKVQ